MAVISWLACRFRSRAELELEIFALCLQLAVPRLLLLKTSFSGGSWLREVATARLHTATSIRHVRKDSLVSRRLQILESNAVGDARIGGVAIYRELFGAGLAGQKVALALSQVIAERGAPVSITVDNGIEFASKAMESWAARRRY